jgi:hypothetical protein
VSGQWQPDRVVDALGQDALQTILASANRRRLHSHACESCGTLQCACTVMPCAWRPFDRDARGRWWRCAFCRMAERIVREAANEG